MRRKTIDDRMESFVASCGVVPADAHRLEDFEARRHAATWIQRLIGAGISCHQVIGYALGNGWWTFCFDRHAELEPDAETEIWRVEAYDSIGRGWRDTFTYSIPTEQWRLHVPASRAGTPDHLARGSGRS